MPLILLKALKWLVGKLAGYALALTAALALYAGYLYVSESYQAERERMEELAEARAEAQALYRELEALHGRLVAIAEGIERNREQWEAASRAIETLRSLMNRVERLFLPPEERAAQDEQLEAAQRERAESQAQLDRLSEERGSLRMKRAVAAEEARRLESRIEALESGDAVASAYLEGAWAKLSPYLLYALAALALGPIAIKAALYYGFAPLASRARPVALISERRPAPWLSQSGVSVSVPLAPGQGAWIKESYLQTSDETLLRKTRFVLNWRIPITCLAAGLYELIEMRANRERGEGSIVASTQNKPNMELGLLNVPAGGSMILRPRHVAGLMSEDGAEIRIRPRWAIWRLQSWVSLQFRYFDIEGPCRILVSGVRGVRGEILDGRSPGRRSNQDATIGFTPTLAYAAARAETFWAYFRGRNPLFDDVFRGRGIFICQEIASGAAGGVRRFWSGFFNSAAKALGI